MAGNKAYFASCKLLKSTLKSIDLKVRPLSDYRSEASEKHSEKDIWSCKKGRKSESKNKEIEDMLKGK